VSNCRCFLIRHFQRARQAPVHTDEALAIGANPIWTQRSPRGRVIGARQPPRLRARTNNNRLSPWGKSTVVVIIVGGGRRHDDDSTDSSSRRVQTAIACFVAARDAKFSRRQDRATRKRL